MKIFLLIVLTLACAPAPSWALALADNSLLLVATRSRATLCDYDEACDDGLCRSDGATSCRNTVDCPKCVVLENEDLAMCRPVTLGEDNTACDWSLFLDGSAAGLDAPVRALDVLPDGSLLVRAAADNSVPDIAGVDRWDLVRFIPRDDRGRPTPLELPYTQGEWELFLDGGSVVQNSEGRLMEAISLLPSSCRDVNADGAVTFQECDLLFAPVAAGTLAGIDLDLEDIVRCRPTALSEGGTIEACAYALFYDASEVNDAIANDGVSEKAPGSWSTGGTDSFALTDFDPNTLSATLIFSAGNGPTLPSHQPSRDLLINIGSLGPQGQCDSGAPCLTDDDCAFGACLVDQNPETSEETVVLFDGSDALAGEMLSAVAIMADADGDGVPDPMDNCLGLPNPGACNGSGAACGSSADCPLGDACRQGDADGDGVGDACDRCAGRDDSECFCGDFVVDVGVEQCDLGAPEADGFNGRDGSPCTEDCQIIGRCTRSGATCSTASECGEFLAGEGCCGNGTMDFGADPNEADEACDDGNALDDDGCNNQCRIVENPIPLPSRCEGVVGPKVVPTFVRTLRFQKQRRQVAADQHPDYFSKWSSRGEFSLVPGIEFDPDSQNVELVFSQGQPVCQGGTAIGTLCADDGDCPESECDTTLWRGKLPPGAMKQAGKKQDRPRWSFKERHGKRPGALAWTDTRFAQRLATIRRPLNEVRFMLKGRGDRLDPQISLHVDPTAMGGPPTRIRQTLIIGDLCTTQTLTCEPNRPGTTLRCFSRVD